MKNVYLLLLFCLIIRSECLLTKGNKKHMNSSHTNNISKKQQVLVPLGNFAASSYGKTNAVISPMFQLEGTNEVGPLKEPTSVFLNGDNRQANPYMVPMKNQQTEDNEGPMTEAPLAENDFRTDSSLFDDGMESFRGGANGNENSDNDNEVYADDNQQVYPYNEQTNGDYLNQTPEEEATEPSRTMVDYNNYDSNYISNTAVHGLPTLSSPVASRLRAENTLNSLGLRHSALGMPKYASLVKQLLKNKAFGVKNVFKFDPEMRSGAAKKENATKVHSNTDAGAADDEERKREDDKKQEQEYKKIRQNAEMAANLAEAAKTLTKLVKTLAKHDALISRKQEEDLEARKNSSEAVGGEGWSAWSKWSRCSATCGTGLSYTKRNCTSSFGNHHCSGRRIRVRMCNLNRCNTSHDKKVNLQRSLSEMAEARSRIDRT